MNDMIKIRIFSWVSLFGSIGMSFNFRKPKATLMFFLSSPWYLRNQTEELGKWNHCGCMTMNCIFLDNGLCAKSACRRCLLLICGRNIRLGHLIYFLGAIISWWIIEHCGEWHLMELCYAQCMNFVLLLLQNLLPGETSLVSELKYSLFIFLI